MTRAIFYSNFVFEIFTKLNSLFKIKEQIWLNHPMKEVYCCHMKKSLKPQKLLPTTTNSIHTSIINKVQGQNASLDYRDHSKNKKSKCCWPEPVTKLRYSKRVSKFHIHTVQLLFIIWLMVTKWWSIKSPDLCKCTRIQYKNVLHN